MRHPEKIEKVSRRSKAGRDVARAADVETRERGWWDLRRGSGKKRIRCSDGQEGGTGRGWGGRKGGHSSAMAAQAPEASPHSPAQDTLQPAPAPAPAEFQPPGSSSPLLPQLPMRLHSLQLVNGEWPAPWMELLKTRGGDETHACCVGLAALSPKVGAARNFLILVSE